MQSASTNESVFTFAQPNLMDVSPVVQKQPHNFFMTVFRGCEKRTAVYAIIGIDINLAF